VHGKNLFEELFLIVLFSRLTFRSTRGSGRNLTGEITLWGRRGVTRVEPRWAGSAPVGGVARRWGVSTLVGPAGLTWRGRTPTGGGSKYLYSGVGPLPGTHPGWSTLLKWIPVGTNVNSTGWAARSPGSTAKVLRHRAGLVQLRLPSRVVTWVSSTTRAVLGGTPSSKKITPTNAGGAWRAGRRPHVRGVAMNPVDHPHGGGQGKTSGGRPGVTPWGRLTRGVPTGRPRK